MLQKTLNIFIKSFLLLLPFQTVWIYDEIFLNGVKSQWGTGAFFATEVLLWVGLSLFIIYLYKGKNFKFQISNFKFSKDRVFLFCVLLYTFYFLLSTFWALEFDIALQQSVRVMEGLLLCVMLLAGPWKFKDLVPWFIGGAVISSVIGIGQFLTQSTFSSTLFGMSMYMSHVSGVSVVASDTIGRWLRAYGTFVHPNVFGGYMVVASIVWTLWIREKIFNFQFSTRAKVFPLIFNFFVLFILLSGLLFSFSRSALLSYFLFLISYFLYSLYRKHWSAIKYVVVSGVFLIIMSIIVWPLMSVRLGVTSLYETQSIVERSELMHGAWDIAQDHLWLGSGMGNYVFSLYQFDSTLSGWAYQPVHNIFLLLLVEVGIVGLLLISLSMLALLWWLQGEIGTKKHVWFFVCMGGLIYGTIGLFDHYPISLYSGIMLSGVFFGLILLYIRDILHK